MPMPRSALTALTSPSAAPGITMNVSNMMVFHGPANLQLWPMSLKFNPLNPGGFSGSGSGPGKPWSPPPKPRSRKNRHHFRFRHNNSDEGGSDGGDDDDGADSDSCHLCRYGDSHDSPRRDSNNDGRPMTLSFPQHDAGDCDNRPSIFSDDDECVEGSCAQAGGKPKHKVLTRAWTKNKEKKNKKRGHGSHTKDVMNTGNEEAKIVVKNMPMTVVDP